MKLANTPLLSVSNVTFIVQQLNIISVTFWADVGFVVNVFN